MTVPAVCLLAVECVDNLLNRSLVLLKTKLDRTALYRHPIPPPNAPAPQVEQKADASSSSSSDTAQRPPAPSVNPMMLPPITVGSMSASTSASTSTHSNNMPTSNKPTSKGQPPQQQTRVPQNPPGKPRSSSSTNAASRQAAIEAAMAAPDVVNEPVPVADETDGMLVDQPTRPATPEVAHEDGNQRGPHDTSTMFSFGSEDDMLFAEVNLECYNNDLS